MNNVIIILTSFQLHCLNGDHLIHRDDFLASLFFFYSIELERSKCLKAVGENNGFNKNHICSQLIPFHVNIQIKALIRKLVKFYCLENRDSINTIYKKQNVFARHKQVRFDRHTLPSPKYTKSHPESTASTLFELQAWFVCM